MNLTIRQVRVVLRHLLEVPDLEDSPIQDFLSFVSVGHPEDLVHFFLKRLTHPARRKGNSYTPVPFRVHFNFATFKTHPKYPSLLNEICSLMQLRRFEFDYYLPKVFWLIVSDETGIQVLTNVLKSGVRKGVLAAGRLLSNTHENFPFDRPDIIELALASARRLDDECYQQMASMLMSPVVTGSKTGIPGQPMPRDIEVKERADKLIKRYAAKAYVASFYRELKEHADRDIKRTVDEFEEQVATL